MHSAIGWGCAPSPTPAPPPPPSYFDPNPCVVDCSGPAPITDTCLTNPNSLACVGYNGSPQDGEKCDGSQFEVGSPVVPANQNAANATYYVNDISNIWQNGVIVAVVYQVSTPGASGQNYDLIQETNNGALWNWGASAGLNFGPANISVSGGQTYSMVSPLTWFFPGQTPLPSGLTFASCWPKAPMPA